MKKRKLKRVTPPASAVVIGVGWYTPSEWERVKATAIDPDVFEDSFSEWESMADDSFALERKRYPNAVKVFIDADELLAWCHLRAQANNSGARSEFVVQKLQASAPSTPSQKC